MNTTHLLDTGKVELPSELMELTELLARNVHKIWMEQRLAKGWTYGEERNDALKEHPCLVPYDELSEDEKVYDRNSAVETLKTIILLGYRIKK